MTIVDLDVAPRIAERPPRMVPSRSLALFVIGLLTLVLVTASARPAPEFGRALWSAPFDQDNDTMTLTPTSVFLFHHDAGGPTLTAYDLGTGAARWSAPAPDLLAQVPSVADGVVVAPDAFQKYFNRPDLILARTTVTIARDVSTGAVLWRAAGAAQDVTDRSVLLADGDTGQLRDVSLHDGQTLWTRTVPQLLSVVTLGDSVVTAATDGRLTVLRYADGTVVRTKKVPWPDNGWLSVAAGRLVVTSQASDGQTATVYRPDTLAEAWHSDGGLTDCYPVLCGSDSSGLTGYEPDTGAVRWRVPAMTIAWPVSADRIIASSELNGQFQLLDPATGRRVGAVGTGLGSWRPDIRSAVDDAPAAASAYLLRSVPEDPDESAVVRLDLPTGDQDVLGAVNGTGWNGCHTVTRYLICQQNTRLTVTAVG